jgi:hypothetical protein
MLVISHVAWSGSQTRARGGMLASAFKADCCTKFHVSPLANPGLEVRSCGNAILLNPPTIAPQC